jgi:3-dehydroquinate synthase
MAEVIKYGCIRDEKLFAFLEAHPDQETLFPHLSDVIAACCAIKASVVLEDEHDTGARRLLNYGHTLGHAVELYGHYETYNHGEAVAVGMCLINPIGEALGVTPHGIENRLVPLLASFGLPTVVDCPHDAVLEAIRLDKKGEGSEITVILLESIGRAVPVKLPQAKLAALVLDLPEKG